MQRQLSFTVNGQQRSVATDDDRPLLDVLREDFSLTGTKFGCGEGQCGACTVLLNGQTVRSCITPVSEAADQQVQTIEGLADGDRLHPVQQAFLDEEAMQCGYCVPGQILTAVELLNNNARPSREEIVEAMSGNLCRCCNYANILNAVNRAAELR